MAHVSVESPVQQRPQLLENLNVSSSTSSYNFFYLHLLHHTLFQYPQIPLKTPRKRKSETELLLLILLLMKGLHPWKDLGGQGPRMIGINFDQGAAFIMQVTLLNGRVKY